jgi:anoctamin-10
VTVPFGNWIVPKLDFFAFFLPKSIEETKNLTPNTFAINSFRLKRQLIYFAVTAQIVGFAMENFVPYLTRRAFSEARKMTAKEGQEDVSAFDKEEEKAYLARVRAEAELPEYDIYTDYAEMVVQVCPLFVLWMLMVVWICGVMVNYLAYYAFLCSTQQLA